MFYSIILAMLIGCALGTITGLIPGLHTNLLAVIILSTSSFLLPFVNLFFLIIMIISMGLMHTFLDIIPATFLGVPDSSTLESVLPAQKLVQQGYGMNAIIYGLFGSFASLLLTLILIPFLLNLLPSLVLFIESKLVILLLFPIIFVSLKQNSWNKLLTFIIFLVSGFFAYFIFESSLQEPLLALFTGYFGMSSLFLSLRIKNTIPFQTELPPKIAISKTLLFLSLLKAFIGGGFTGLLPGIGNSQAALIDYIKFKSTQHNDILYLVLTAGINTVNFIFSLITLFLFNKSRNGTIIVVQELLSLFSKNFFYMSLCIVLIVGSIGFLWGKYLARLFILLMNRISYQKLSIIICVILIVLVFVMSGLFGFSILICSTALGIFVQLKGIPRSSLMGTILVPVLLYLLL